MDSFSSWLTVITLSNLVFAHQHDLTSNQSFSMEVVLDKYKIHASWNIDWSFNFVELKIESNIEKNQKKWILIGFADTHDIYENTDFCLFDDGKLWDGWVEKSKDSYPLHYDFHQDCNLVAVDEGNNLGFTFRRKFLTCDPRDYAIEIGTANFVFAIGDGKPTNLKDPSVVYDMRYNQLLQRNLGDWKTETEGVKFLEIRADNAHVPDDVTTYWCITVNLNDELKKDKHHITMIEAIISPGLEDIIHHMEIFHCPDPVKQEFNGNCNYKPEEAPHVFCNPTYSPITYPPEAGMPFGGPGYNPVVMVEIHYNNVEQKKGIIDTSGFRISYTKTLRPNDAAIMELGLIYSDANSIPPGQKSWAISGQCVADCTNKFPKEGITIFASQLHAHLTGRKLWTSHYRNGVKLGEINRDNHFSPHWQIIRRFQGLKKVLPGDVLTTTCVYETMSRSNWTWGGYGIEDEMCVNYIYYYPASEVEVCKSAVDNSTLHKFFSALGVPEKSKLLIHEKYLKVRWNERRYKFLNELYNVGPLNMHCLDHTGSLFTGHKSNWTNIPRPETFAGVFNKDRDPYECPSIND